MSRSSPLCTPFVLVVLLLGLCLPAAAEDPLAGPHAFDDGLQALRAQLQSGDPKEAVEALKALLESHKRKDYVKARRAEIEELMGELSCAAKHGRPQAKDLVKGKLESWSPDSGKIKIRFTPDRSGDLAPRDGLPAFPARLTGPFTLEIKGKKYPVEADQRPRVVLWGGADPKSGKPLSWRFDYSLPQKAARSSKKVAVTTTRVEGGDEKKLSEKSGTAPKPGKPYKLVVKGTKTKLTAALGSRKLGSASKPKGMFGFLGFRAGGWTEATLKGEIDPSWLQEKIDEVLRTQWLEFETDYDADEHLPRWLSEPISRRRSGSKRPALDLLADLDAKFTDPLQDVHNGIRLEEYDEALAAIATMQSGGAPEAACEYLRADVRKAMSQFEDSLVHLGRCLELQPTYLDAVLMQGQLFRQLGRFDEALVAFERATAGGVQYVRAYEEAASSMLMAGRPADAKRLTQLAARNGVNSETLITLNVALGKVVKGPKWRKRYEHKSDNYHVISNMDDKTCKEASDVLEESFAAFRETFGWVEQDKTRLFKVYMFNTQEGFIDYQGELEEFMGSPSEKAAGLFSPLLKQLLIWNLPRRESMIETVRHEGFHQYLDRLMPSPPVWFNEGLAVYHENPARVDGKLVFAQPQPMYVRLLLVKGLIPLKKFLFGGHRQFYEDGHRSYGQAWLFVHMLKHSKPEYAALFQRVVKELQTESSYRVLQKNFPPESIPQLAKDLKAYLEKLAHE